MLNATVFVVVVTAMTFVLVWLFKRCARQGANFLWALAESIDPCWDQANDCSRYTAVQRI